MRRPQIKDFITALEKFHILLLINHIDDELIQLLGQRMRG